MSRYIKFFSSGFPYRTVFLCRSPLVEVPPFHHQPTPRNKVYTRNVVCFPPAVDTTRPIAIPRGDTRARLNEQGLIGRVAINSSWKASEVECEISSTFASLFFPMDEMYYHFTI